MWRLTCKTTDVKKYINHILLAAFQDDKADLIRIRRRSFFKVRVSF